jgi:hypothetical protein
MLYSLFCEEKDRLDQNRLCAPNVQLRLRCLSSTHTFGSRLATTSHIWVSNRLFFCLPAKMCAVGVVVV